MYSFLLALHSLVRWFVLAALLLALYRAYRGWLGHRPYTRLDDTIRHGSATILHIQFMLGVILYFISPIVDYFLKNFNVALHERQIRFFGMEHSSMMFLAVVLVSVGSSLAKRRNTDAKKFKTMAIWFTIGLLVILSSVPWAFSPLISRPYFRGF
jgi:hypothetical protein